MKILNSKKINLRNGEINFSLFLKTFKSAYYEFEIKASINNINFNNVKCVMTYRNINGNHYIPKKDIKMLNKIFKREILDTIKIIKNIIKNENRRT